MNVALSALAALLLLAGPTVPTPTPDNTPVHMIQVSAAPEQSLLDDFTAATQSFLSCDQARNFAQQKNLRLVEDKS